MKIANISKIMKNKLPINTKKASLTSVANKEMQIEIKLIVRQPPNSMKIIKKKNDNKCCEPVK